MQGVWDWLKHVTGRLVRPLWGARQGLPGLTQPGSQVGPWSAAWTDSRYEMVRHFKHWTYVAIDKVATGVCMHPPNVSRLLAAPSLARDRTRLLGPGGRRRALTPLMTHEELEPAASGHPLTRLLADPNEPDTAYDLWYETVMYLLLTGNAYWWVPPGPLGPPLAAWVLPSHWVYAHAARDGSIEAYEVRPVEGMYTRAVVPAQDVIHFKKKSPVSKVDGYSPQSAGAPWIDTQESVDRSRWFSFRNGIFPGVSIEFDEGARLPDEKDLDRIEARLASRYGGEWNTSKPIFVPPGAKLKPIQLTPRELMYVESTDQLRDQILALYGVPATVAGVNRDMTYGSILASQASFYMLTLNPLFRYLGQVLTEKLAPRYGGGPLRVWWEDRTPQDPELQEKQLATDLAYGARTMNEVRSLRGLERYEAAWADQPWMPLNTVPVDEALRLASQLGADRQTGGGSPGRNPATQHDANNIPSGEGT
jgi:HK97 family phage portal protein